MTRASLLTKLISKDFFRNWLKHVSTSSSFNAKDPGNYFDTRSQFQPPLTEPLPGLPEAVYAVPGEIETKLMITKLDNGLHVTSLPYFGSFCTVGVVIDAGSKYTGNPYVPGITNMLDKLSFKSNSSYEDTDKIMLELEQYGGIFDSQFDRDFVIYAMSAKREALPVVIKILGEVVLRPNLTVDEISKAAEDIIFDSYAMSLKPDQTMQMNELLHKAAFYNGSYGLPLISPKENLPKITRNLLFTYLANYYSPSRMVLAGIGVNHNELESLAKTYFEDRKPIWQVQSDLVLHDAKYKPSDEEKPVDYVGGIELDKCELPLGHTELPVLAHVMIGFEGVSFKNPKFITMSVLNMLMGGGNSFSSGGPGKGMYSRLFLRVLNRYQWVYTCQSFSYSYASSGLFGIHGCAPPERLDDLVTLMAKELCQVAKGDMTQAVQRAKKQLISLFLMNLESRPMMFEDVARQVMALKTWHSKDYYIDAIEAVTQTDIQEMAAKMVETQPCVAARGRIDLMPDLKVVCEEIRAFM